MTRHDRKLSRLSRRVRALEAALAEFNAPPEFNGPRMTQDTVHEKYMVLRKRAVRFCELRVHPDMANDAVALAESLDLRAMQRVTADDTLPRGGWDLVAL